MPTTKTIGDRGERTAINFLLHCGYTIRKRNYRYGRNEIDIIAEHEGLLVFVEVKQRNTAYFGFPEESVDWRKQRRIMKAAQEYIYRIDWRGDVRYDIIAILTAGGELELEHFKDVFA